MAKMMAKDSQIILNMLRIQDDIQDILNSDDFYEESVKLLDTLLNQKQLK